MECLVGESEAASAPTRACAVLGLQKPAFGQPLGGGLLDGNDEGGFGSIAVKRKV
jgi:hypothetical protein